MTFRFPDAAIALHTACFGKTGAGKTSTAKLIVEQIVREDPKARVCVLDPFKSDWWGITSSSSGKSAGLPFVILGGPRGHVPLTSSAGKAIGELVATGKLPLSIIDMAHFEAGGLQKFYNAFAEELMKKIRGVLYLVIEEAHEFAPKELSGIGAETTAIYWSKKLATGGRSKGIRLIVLTQRTQSLHNALIGSCDTMIAHRFTSPADQAPIIKWLKANAKKDEREMIEDSLSSLKTGRGWMVSSEAGISECIDFPKIKTYDNSKTPSNNDEITEDIRTASVDLEKLKTIVGTAVDQAAADDPDKLRALAAEAYAKRDDYKSMFEQSQRDQNELAIDLEAERKKAPDATALFNERAAGYDEGVDAGIYQANLSGAALVMTAVAPFTERLRDLAGDLDRALAGISRGIAENKPKIPELASRAPTHGAAAPMPPTPPRARAVPVRASTATAREGGSALSGSQSRVVDALRFWMTPQIGNKEPTRAMVAAVAGYRVKSGGFRNLLSELSTAGAIAYPAPGLVQLIDPNAGHPFRQSEAVATLRQTIGPTGMALVDQLAKTRGNAAMSREQLATATGREPTSGGFRNLLSELHTIDVITYPAPKMVALTAWSAILFR